MDKKTNSKNKKNTKKKKVSFFKKLDKMFKKLERNRFSNGLWIYGWLTLPDYKNSCERPEIH